MKYALWKKKGYGKRKTQYADWDNFRGSLSVGKNIGHGSGAGCTFGWSVTWTGALGVTTCILINWASWGLEDLK